MSDIDTPTGVPAPSPALQALDRLVGTWRVGGGAEGTVTYEWMEGGFFLLQRVDLVQNGRAIRGLEVVGHLRPFGEGPSENVHSRFYDRDGNTFDYTYKLADDTLRIWAGQKGSPAYFEGQFTDDRRACKGEWVYPGGGGYRSTMQRV